jgi:SNF2 family DNA or RNA helicase
LKGGAQSKPTQIWVNYKNLCANAGFLYFISGTPMVNKAAEMWAYMHIFDPVKFDNFKRFERTFSMFDPGTMSYKLNAGQLMQTALRNQMISRKKSEVGIQLPELTRVVRMLEFTDEQRELHTMLMKEFQIWMNKNKTPDDKINITSMLAQLTRQRQVGSYPAGITYTDDKTGMKTQIDFKESAKIDEAMDIIEALFDAGENCVLSSTFNAPLFRVQELCREKGIECRVLNGDNPNDANIFEQDFQNDKFTVFALNSACGEGLNLQKDPRWNGGAATVIMLDLWYSPARNEQVEARVHRMGAFDNVTCYVLQIEDSVDQLIVDILEDKSLQFESVLEKQELRPLSALREKYPNIFGVAS